MSTVKLPAEPHNWIPYVHTGLIIVLQTILLLLKDSREPQFISQESCLILTNNNIENVKKYDKISVFKLIYVNCKKILHKKNEREV